MLGAPQILLFIVYSAIGLIFGLWGKRICVDKGRPASLGLFLGIFLTFVGIIICYLIPKAVTKSSKNSIDSSTAVKFIENDDDPEGLYVVRGAIKIVIFSFISLSVIALLI